MTDLATSKVRVTTAPGASRRPRRRHPALGARIATAGLSTAAMFSIVAVLGAQDPPAATATEWTASEAGIVVVDPRVAAPQAVTVSELSDQPIQLTATPVVRAAQSVPADSPTTPVARTNGSR